MPYDGKTEDLFFLWKKLSSVVRQGGCGDAHGAQPQRHRHHHVPHGLRAGDLEISAARQRGAQRAAPWFGAANMSPL